MSPSNTTGIAATHPDSAERIVITGSTGLVGTALLARLEGSDLQPVRALRRPAAGSGQVTWHPDSGSLTGPAPRAVVHLAGENIASGRWNEARKLRIRDSRVAATEKLSRHLAGLEQRPRVLVCASAIGFYGNRAEEPMDETSEPGIGFLADVCRDWEAAADAARQAGIRVVHLRFGVVLSTKGGALKKMLTPFRFGLGGRLGKGSQWMSWVSLDDAVGAIEHVLHDDRITGPLNVVAPNAVTNAEFTRALGRVLRRPTLLPVPAPVVRLLLGEMGQDLMLASTRVRPRRLTQNGYEFHHPTLEMALEELLGREA